MAELAFDLICFLALPNLNLQMKADFATDTKCNGWRRMTFVDGICEVDETPSKILASYELQKVSWGRAACSYFTAD